ncbi:branched-chain amino acid ABC transporter permease [soil metagenome]
MQSLFRRRQWIHFIWLGILLLGFPFLYRWPVTGWFITRYRIFSATMFGVWLLVVLSLNLLTGYSGQISLGHAAFVLIGAYATAILQQQARLPLPFAILGAGLCTGLVGGVLIGLPAVRLSGHYLSIATFALAIALPQVLKIKFMVQWTNGARGIHLAQHVALSPLNLFLNADQYRYYGVMAVTVLMTILFWNLMRSRYGRALLALREHEIGAQQMGVPVAFYKALAFGISAVYAGIAGGLFFFVQGYVSPDSLGLFDSVLLVVAIVIGGLGSMPGSLFGAFFLTFQADIISALAHWLPHADNLGSVLFGLLLILATITFPQGVAGFVRQSHARLRWLQWARTRPSNQGATQVTKLSEEE